MTTIILTIIGILLAAAAALMVIFYGGDAFNSGSIGAQANTLQNAGTNVESAATLYRTENASDAGDIDALVAGGYLKESPALTGVGENPTLAGADTAGYMFTVSNVSPEVCNKVNENLSVGTAATTDVDGNPVAASQPAIGSTKMGCNGGTFFASL